MKNALVRSLAGTTTVLSLPLCKSPRLRAVEWVGGGRLYNIAGASGRAPEALHSLAKWATPATLHKNPDRLEEVNKKIAAFGCTVVTQYAVLGFYDFVSIVEASDNETAAHLSIDLGSRGSVSITTLQAISTTRLRDKLRGPKQMGQS